ncbi:MAG: glycosyltransferase family 4 protein [bacterium]|nr:glycosyltransferase family 4 protein [bacterium]
MRLLICTGIFPPEIGGPATYSKTLAAEFSKRGHEVMVITYSDKESGIRNYESRLKFPVNRISRSWFKPWHYYKYFRAVKKHGRWADLIYAQDPVSAGYPSYLASRILKKPFAVKITGDYSWEQATSRGLTDKMIDEFQNLESYSGPIKKIRRIQVRVCKEARLVIVPSEYLKRIVLGWGVKEKRIKVIYNAIKQPDLRISKEEARQKHGISADDFLIVSAGRNVPWKGFSLLREVVDELKQTNPHIRLEILHEAPQQTLHQYIKAADVFVLNTAYEGLSHILVEAMAIGTPIITTNVCGNPEVVEDGKTGILIEFNNTEQLRQAIAQIMADAGLRQKYSGNGQEILTKFSFDKMIEETERILKECAS